MKEKNEWGVKEYCNPTIKSNLKVNVWSFGSRVDFERSAKKLVTKQGQKKATNYMDSSNKSRYTVDGNLKLCDLNLNLCDQAMDF